MKASFSVTISSIWFGHDAISVNSLKIHIRCEDSREHVVEASKRQAFYKVFVLYITAEVFEIFL